MNGRRHIRHRRPDMKDKFCFRYTTRSELGIGDGISGDVLTTGGVVTGTEGEGAVEGEGETGMEAVGGSGEALGLTSGEPEGESVGDSEGDSEGSGEGDSEGSGLGDSLRLPKMFVGPPKVGVLKDLYSRP